MSGEVEGAYQILNRGSDVHAKDLNPPRKMRRL